MIELKDLTVKYDDFVAVKNIDVEIKDGEFFTFLGPSGCGKTTTLRCISGFEKPAEGRILVSGVDVTKLLPEERNIGFVFQNYALFPTMSVFDNIAYGLKVRKLSKDIIKEKVEKVASKVGISEHLRKKVSDLSGGQQQRIAIARALVVEPKILLMDEPLSNLDAKLRVSTREEIKRLQSDLKITTIYVTHDQEEALAISDTIAVFNKGTIDQIGTPYEIYDKPKNPFVAEFIGEINVLDEKLKEKLVDDKKMLAYVRPEKVMVCKKCDHCADTATFNGTVSEKVFLGAFVKLNISLDIGSKIACMQFASQENFEANEKVIISINKKDILTFKELS